MHKIPDEVKRWHNIASEIITLFVSHKVSLKEVSTILRICQDKIDIETYVSSRKPL